MKKSDGKVKIDGVAVLEMSISLIPSQRMLAVKYALVNATEGVRYGQGSRNTDWSAKTLQALQDLMDAAEEDVLRDVFEGGTPTDGVAPGEPAPGNGPREL